jgi:2-polyprenyl-6-methoxyphenol hydroxylase-like FAD-dependent oxidoreductase
MKLYHAPGVSPELDQGCPFPTEGRLRDRPRRAALRGHDAAYTPVLIVGAGLVGLVAAVRLREQGVDVRVIDELPAGAKRSQALVLHPRTLRTLSSLGVGAALDWRSHDVTRLAVYTDGQRRALLDLPSAGEVGAGAKTLQEAALHESLLRRLSELGTDVEWQTSFVALKQSPTQVRARLVRREWVESAQPHLGPALEESGQEQVDAEFIVGADGPASTLRRALGIAWLAMGQKQRYAFYETPDEHAGCEASLVIHEGLGSSVYPLPNGIARFSFEIREQDRQAPRVMQLRDLLGARMPWYAASADTFEWSGEAEVNPGMAQSFGAGRVWLTGEAAHSTGLLGAQSVNVGMFEANDLAWRIARALDPSGAQLGLGYAQQRHLEWLRLFGLYPNLPLVGRAEAWVKRNISAVLPSLPATGDDLDDLLDQLHVASA